MKVYVILFFILFMNNFYANEVTVVLYPHKKMYFFSSLNGLITKNSFSINKRVKKGDVLSQLNKAYYLNNLNLNKIQLQENKLQTDYYKIDYKQKLDLLEKGVIGHDKLKEIKLMLELSQNKKLFIENSLELAKYELDLCSIKTPFNAYISEIYVKEYEYIKKGEKIGELKDDSIMNAIFYISSDKSKLFHENDIIEIAIFGNIYKANISHISRKIDPSSNSIKIEAFIENYDFILKEGMTGIVNIK